MPCVAIFLISPLKGIQMSGTNVFTILENIFLICTNFVSSQTLGQAPAVSVVATEKGVSGIVSTGLIAARDGKNVTTEATGTKSPREASAESHRNVVGGAETAGLRLSLFVALPA